MQQLSLLFYFEFIITYPIPTGNLKFLKLPWADAISRVAMVKNDIIVRNKGQKFYEKQNEED